MASHIRSPQMADRVSGHNGWHGWTKCQLTPHITSAYRSQPNGLVERAIGKLKASAERIGEMNPPILLKILFEINVTPTQDSTGSPASKFFGRSIRSSLPNSVDREIERRQLTKRRQENQTQLYLKKGRSSKDQFHIGDKVGVRNHIGGRWDKKGVLVEERSTGTASPPSSFIIIFEDGHSGLRHKSYMKHEISTDSSGSDPVDSSAGLQPTSTADYSADPETGSDATDAPALCIAPGPTTRSRARRKRA